MRREGGEARTYRCPKAWTRWTALTGGAAAAWTGYLGFTAGQPFDIALGGFLAIVAVVVTAAVLWRLLSRSTSASASGLTIRAGRAAVFVPWAGVAALLVDQVVVTPRRGFGSTRPTSTVCNDRGVVVYPDGTEHLLPYLSSNAGCPVAAEVADLRRIWRRERGAGWTPSPLPPRLPVTPERRARAVLLVVAAEFVLACAAVLLIDVSSRTPAPADGIAGIVFLTLLLAVPTLAGTFLRRRRATLSPAAAARPAGKRRAR